MANIVQRNLHLSLAKSLIEVAEETGVAIGELVKLMNDEYEYVDRDNPRALSTLEKQMELDIAAEKHARNNKVQVDGIAVARTALKRKMGTLVSDFQASIPDLNAP